jgi:ATP-dependent Lon protease
MQLRHSTHTGYSYETMFVPYFAGAKSIEIEDPYIRLSHQTQYFVRFCEAVVKFSRIKRIDLITGYEDEIQKQDIEQKLSDLKQSLLELDIVFNFDFNSNLHDREIRLDNGWVIKIGRRLDFYQKPQNWKEIGSNDISLRKCMETKVDIFKL